MTYRNLAWLRRTQADGPVYSKIHLFRTGEHTALCGLSVWKQLEDGKIISQPGPGLKLAKCQRCLKTAKVEQAASDYPPVIEFDGRAAGG